MFVWGLCDGQQARALSCERACVWGGVTRIGYKYSQALLIMNRCTWAFLSPESRRSPETGRALWNASSSCSLAVCLWRPHQKLGQVQRFSHDTEFLSLVLIFPSALQKCWEEPKKYWVCFKNDYRDVNVFMLVFLEYNSKVCCLYIFLKELMVLFRKDPIN